MTGSESIYYPKYFQLQRGPTMKKIVSMIIQLTVLSASLVFTSCGLV